MVDPQTERSFGLGRGLDALIPGAVSASAIQQIAVDRIVPNPHQPRTQFATDDLESLANSIRIHGVIQPVVLRASATGDYELVAGERRLRAARMAGLSHVPAVVRSSSEVDMLQLALIENLQRADLNPIEEAVAFDELATAFGLTHDQIAAQVGKSRAAVSNALRLLELQEGTRRALLDGRISEGHGRALASLTQPEVQEAALEIILERRMSVRQAEELVRRRSRAARSVGVSADDDIAALEARLRQHLATRVSIVRSRRGGRIVIDFGTAEELERLTGLIESAAGPDLTPGGWPA